MRSTYTLLTLPLIEPALFAAAFPIILVCPCESADTLLPRVATSPAVLAFIVALLLVAVAPLAGRMVADWVSPVL